MSSFRIRPRFNLVSDLPVREIEQVFLNLINMNEHGLNGIVSKNFITIKINENDNHFWSPRLGIMLEEIEGNKTKLLGLYGPNPSVWALFTYSYGAILISIFFITLFGLSMYSLGEGLNLLWWNLPLILLGLVLYIIAQFGQKIGADQMYKLHHFFEEVVKSEVKIN
ncbi:hypothetical protein OAQ99_03825 [Candidatus Kapabacteria bacterium]|nr:hypothetical protein [Candidatus Kapabacteria bacterium]